MTDTQLDYLFLSLITVIIIAGIISTILNPQKYSIKNPQVGIRNGILIMLGIIVVNSAKENNWSVGYISSFVCLKKVSHGNYLRELLAISYIPTIWSVLQLLFEHKFRKTKDDQKRR